MADFRTEASMGARIQAARKSRGFRTARDLANAISGGNVSESILENIEAGRKVNVDISQLLNIAMALKMPLSYLLVPLGAPAAELDLANLSDGFDRMTVAEFDSWLAAVPDGAYRADSIEERNAVAELQALREWTALSREKARLEAARSLESEAISTIPGLTDSRLTAVEEAQKHLSTYLASAGWEL